ncbi:DUF7527 domain-containing protein [Halorussus pelagicus]|uniref:DUF7527 domain-containing protein n=1 Tax=Halorussus pelagicus TaxID=2505977 RepID=UPI000FFB507D|nr:transcriptional regulator [Halorussus pelagicus]
METRTVEQVKTWKTRSFADGYAGLRELSDGEFSGAVRAGGAWLFMLNGRIIGVYEGSLDDFEDADGTAYAAPHPSLPLLFSMQERGGETQAKYYTNDTPLSEVDSTLTSGKFTGYIELSENVLSGDYYVAYYGGRSMSVAFVGASEQIITGDDAFERANDEVGIYEVTDVSIEVTDVPEPEEPEEPEEREPSGGTGAGSGGASSAGASSAGASGSSGTGGESRTGGESGASGTSGAGETRDTRSADSRGASEQTGSGSDFGAGASESSESAGKPPSDASRESDASADDSPSTGVSTAPSTDTPSARDTQSTDPAERSGRDRSGRTDSAGSPSTASHVEASAPASDADASPSADAAAAEVETAGSETEPSAGDSRETETSPDASEQVGAGTRAKEIRDSTTESDGETGGQEEGGAFADEEQWRETTTIPSLDPDRSEGPDGALADDSSESATDDGDSPDSTPRASASKRSPSVSASKSTPSASTPKSAPGASESDPAPSRTTETETEKESGTETASGRASGRSSGETSDEAREKIQKLRTQLKQRKQQVEQLKSRLSNVESERNEYKRERDALRQEVERLEAKLENAGSAASASDKRQLDASQAFDGTNLFVRYESKGKATLDEAAEGNVEAGDVNANLRLEHHTQFETENVEVGGEAFESFLTDSFEYRFVSWIIEELLYEIRDTGHRGSLKDLYESIPKIDRVDLHGSVSAGNGDDTRQEAFDIIMRDRMGNPLVVADLNDSRDPTTGEMMGSLVDAASDVAQVHDELSGSFQVTESFFEPEALETTESATSGGFLSREKRESFVKLSRKRGYHLCLVESRSGGFHLNVPEL